MSIVGGKLSQEKRDALYKKYHLDPNNIPTHIAFIMDGNGRWAQDKGLPRALGHQQGASAIEKTIKAAAEFNIHYLSFYAFSTENWKRPEKEVSFLMDLLKKMAEKQRPKLKKEGVRVKCIGNLSQFPKDTKDSLEQLEIDTACNNTVQVNLMLNYGSRDEITRSVRTIATLVKEGALSPDDISEDTIQSHLYTHNIPDPDIIVRTSNEHRLSNFMLWQASYSEFIFLNAHWPTFNQKIVADTLTEYQSRNRRFGGL